MASITEEVRAKAEIYQGDAICQEKTKEFLKEKALPNGLLPLKDIEEVGYDRESGTVWLKQKQSIVHKFEEIGKLVSYETVVTAVAETGKIKKLTGVKAKELLVWVTLNEIVAEEIKKITFKTPAGLSRTFPYSAFEVPEKENVPEEEKKDEKVAEEEKPVSASEASKAVEVKEV
ncbi:PREDICTED: uncharacterized protein LOC104816860 [Tarenaya hassleriana]|uniref:uncharacterized protein LOC104816860 n=1 Tax=Tarenaya hassleriana TaxID=28532 RepID=UPI00053C632D|nr:PREDICTED: uncharacterized protein LOC104816860 [Tarenaya hassleriana]